MFRLILSLFISLIFTSVAFAEFDFGTSCDGEGGSGNFLQYIESWDNDPEKTVTVGTIPSGITDVDISLTSNEDVDIRIYDTNETPIVHWPNGILSSDKAQSTFYNNVAIEYSGYNGGGTGLLGHEYIRITGTTQKDFIMKAFGYQAGYAQVNYSWKGKECGGTFQQQILDKNIIKVGDIPPGINNLSIQLISDKDVDIQLYDKDDGTKIVVWPDGILNGDLYQSTYYQGMTIEWSGYNGGGVGLLGHEYIKITGKTTRNLTMMAYGYQAGYAQVDYSWGGTSDIIVETPVELFQSPINADDVEYPCYDYDRDVPKYGGYHVGKDYCTELNDPVYASNYGKVVVVESGNNHGFGKTVIIEHKLKNKIEKGKSGMSDTIYSFYAHLNSYNVSVGDTVNKGEEIANVGSSGSGSGGTVHLHYEVKYSNMNGIPNPDGLNIGSSFGYDINHPDKVGFISPNTIVNDSKYGVMP